jgi:hypothetical protein
MGNSIISAAMNAVRQAVPRAIAIFEIIDQHITQADAANI